MDSRNYFGHISAVENAMTHRRDYGDEKAEYIPTPAQIKAEAALIRAENEALGARGSKHVGAYPREPFELPVFSLPAWAELPEDA